MNWFLKMSQQEEIVGVAIRLANGKVYSLPKPNRHGHIFMMFKAMRERGEGVDKSGQTQGFITNTGRFIDRQQAAELAMQTGQITSMQKPGELFSEDLW